MKKRESRSSVSLSDLLEAGLLRRDQGLVFRRKATATAKVTAGGAIRLNGKDYPTPSAAGQAAAGGTATNGWVNWYVQDGGKLTLLDDIRSRYQS